jgi:uncharacterized SAM-binding protein YcdF (DUF218 family)
VLFDSARILSWFVTPSNVILTLGLVGIGLLMTRFARLGMRFLVIGNLLFAVLGISPLGYALILPLEERFPQTDASGDAPNGIIVLGGVIDPELSAARGEIALHEAAERVTAVGELARRYPLAPIVFSGGSSGLNGPREADFATRIFESFGVSAERILLENRSRNTAENARFTKFLIDPKPDDRWLLVTSAYHMPRAIGTFRKAGFQVVGYPVDWQTRGRQDFVSFFGSPVDGLHFCDMATHEWVGLFAYWLGGETSALFPSP